MRCSLFKFLDDVFSKFGCVLIAMHFFSMLHNNFQKFFF